MRFKGWSVFGARNGIKNQLKSTVSYSLSANFIGGEGRGEVVLSFLHFLSHFRSDEFLRIWRQKAVILSFSHHFYISRSLIQLTPNFQQNPFALASPLPIPKTHHNNSMISQIFVSFLVVLQLHWQSMLKAIKLHCQPGQGTIKIENIIPT